MVTKSIVSVTVLRPFMSYGLKMIYVRICLRIYTNMESLFEVKVRNYAKLRKNDKK